MLDDRNSLAEQERMYRPRSVGNRVDVVGVDPNEYRAPLYQSPSGSFGKVRMIFEVLIGSPVPVPARVYQNRLAAKIQSVEAVGADGSHVIIDPDDCAFNRTKVLQRETRNVDPVLISVKRTVDIGTRIRHHLDPANLKFSSWFVSRP
jgi:hypothetical protein